MPPRDLYFESIRHCLIRGIKNLENGVIIHYPQKIRHEGEGLGFILEFPIIPGTITSVTLNIRSGMPIADPEQQKINFDQLVDSDDVSHFQSVVASGERSELKLLSDQAVRLGDEAQCRQNTPHLQEHALDVRKQDLSDFQRPENEVSQVSTISQRHVAQPVGNADQVSHWFLLGKAEILGMKWLELVENALANPEMTDLLEILADLKSVLIDYTAMIDQILVGYAQPAVREKNFLEKRSVTVINKKLNQRSVPVMLPKSRSVTVINKKLKAIISQLKPKCIKQIIPEVIVVTEEDFLCALLGLNSEVANHLKSIPEEFRQHEPDDYYIKSYIEEKTSDAINENGGDIKKCFEECGFTSARAETLAKRYKKSAFECHQSLSQWLERYVDDMFKYVVTVGGDSPRYPVKEKVIDKWVNVELTRYTEDDDGCPQPLTFNVHAVNNPTYKSVEKYLDTNTGQGYWYHGTDHASVFSILEEGIQTRRGRAMQDLSDDDGFYLSSNFKEAKQWAFSWSRPAVIIFKKSAPSQNFKEMNLSNDNEPKWAQIVKYNRCGRSRKCLPEQEFRTEFHESDFVLGPRSKNGLKGTPENESYLSWQPSGYQEGYQQLCIRSEKMAEVFGEVDNIEGVIFY